MKTSLFSAPYSFLEKEKDSLNAALPDGYAPMKFGEVWDRDDLEVDPDLAAWVVNPGQRFIIDASILDTMPNLEVIVTPSTGTNHIDTAECAKRNIGVYGLLDERPTLDTIRASAEFTFLHILMALRRPERGLKEVTEGRWRQNEDDLRGRELHSRSVGIVGLGRIGGNVARWSEAFGATVSYYDPYVDNKDYPKASLEDIFSKSDIVCVSCVLTDETRGMIDGPLFQNMKANAILVNTSRGEVLNQGDLEAFLADRPDVTAGLDVLAGEVTNTHLSAPVVEMHRQGQVLITPHIAGATTDSQGKAAIGAAKLLERFYLDNEN